MVRKEWAKNAVAHEHVDAFDDIEKDFVLAVSDALCSPRNGIRDGHRGTGLDLEFVGLLSDVSEVKKWEEIRDAQDGYGLLENLALCCLWIAKVHHLVHELVNDDEIVSDALLLELLEVFDEHWDETVKEDDDLCSICVSLGESEDWGTVSGWRADEKGTDDRDLNGGCACNWRPGWRNRGWPAARPLQCPARAAETFLWQRGRHRPDTISGSAPCPWGRGSRSHSQPWLMSKTVYFLIRGVRSTSSPLPKSSIPSLPCRYFHTMHSTSNAPCITPATTYVNQLVQLVPGLSAWSMSGLFETQFFTCLNAIPVIMSTDPGTVIHIIGILSTPTSFSRYVCINWGVYWTMARIDDVTPSKVAHIRTCWGTSVVGSGVGPIVVIKYTVVIALNMLSTMSVMSSEGRRTETRTNARTLSKRKKPKTSIPTSSPSPIQAPSPTPSIS